MIICPNCGAENLFDGATQCKKCLAKLTSQTQQADAATPVSENEAAKNQIEQAETQPLSAVTANESAGAAKGSEFEIQEVNFDSVPADVSFGQQTESVSEPKTPPEDRITPEPVEKELTLYRDDELQVRMEHTDSGPAITLTNRLDFDQPESESIQQAETIIPALNERDLLAIPSEEQQNVTRKIIINPNIDKKNQPGQSNIKTENPTKESPREDMAKAPESRPEKISPELLNKISGDQFKPKGVAFYSNNTIKLSGVRLTNGDQFTINNKEFELKEKQSNRLPLYAGIGGGILLLLMLVIYAIGAKSTSSGQVVGVVKDPSSGQLLTGVMVTIKELNRQTQVTPAGFFIFDNIPEGIYTIEAHPEGYPVISDRLTVIKQLTSTASFSLELPDLNRATIQDQPNSISPSTTTPSDKIGLLKLSLSPRDTKVFMDGRYIGQGGQTFKFTVGSHRLILKANGYSDQIQDVEIGEGTNKGLSFALEKKASAAVPEVKTPTQMAQELENSGKFIEALAKYGQIAQAEPNNIEVFFGMARCYRAKGDNSNALSSYLKAARIAGDKGDNQTQLEALSGVLEINPNYLTAIYSRGLIYLNQSNYALAAQDFSRVIEIDSRHLNAHYKLAEAYSKAQNYGAALQTYEQTINLNFTDPKPLAYMAETYLAMGDLKNTKKYYEKFEKSADVPTRNRFNSDSEWQRVKAAIGK